MEIKTKTSLVISIVTVLSAVGGFSILYRFTPKSLKAEIQSHPETTAKNKANPVGSSLSEQLLEAAGKGNFQEVQRLVREGADINIRDKEGTTALTRATMVGHTEIVKFLLNNTSLDSKQKLTALMWAERRGHAEITQFLKEAGVNIAEASLNDQLLYAAIKGGIGEVKLLLNKGVKVDAKDTKDGSTALLLAAEKGHRQIIELLLDRGANVNAKTTHGLTALAIAENRGHPEIVRLLKKAGARKN